MLESIGKLPFAMRVKQAQKSIENHQAQQQVQKEHLLAHKLEKVLERQKLDLMSSYDKFGKANSGLKPQGSIIDMEV